MGLTSVSAALWRRFRALAGSAQLVIAVVIGLVLVSPFASAEETHTGPPSAPAPTTATTTRTTSTVPAVVPLEGDHSSVLRVIDGDTIEVTGGRRVRLIGVDTPETAACFGPEATRYAKELLPPGTPIRLVYDAQRLDRFGRTLAYVYKLSDGVFVNLALAGNGFAQQDTVPPNVAHAEEFRVAAASARTANLGLWSGCGAPATTRPVPATAAPTTRAIVARPVPTTPTPTVGGCHPSYSGACVPTEFSDVDCAGGSGDGPGYVGAKRFQVVGPDVYGLDGNDKDGIACES